MLFRSRPSRRVFLAGDAAHVHSPAGGQGMNTGMQDACNLAWKLALVARGDGREDPLLESYGIERRPVGEEAIEHSGMLTRMANLDEISPEVISQISTLIGQRLTTLVGQPIVIDNRGGASGTIGVDMVARSIPDGYTITIVEAAHVVLPATTAKLPYDLSRDLAPLTLIGVSPQILFMQSASPVKTLKDFIALAKTKPGEIPDRKSTRLNSSHSQQSRMPSSA